MNIKKPEEIPDLFVKAWNYRNADGIADLFDEDAEFVNVVGLWWHTRQDIRKAHAYGLKTIFNKSLLEVRRVKVKYLSDNVAVVHARMRLTGQTALGETKHPASRNNIFSFVAHRTSQGWMCASAHNTDVIPGAETNIITESGEVRAVDYRVR